MLSIWCFSYLEYNIVVQGKKDKINKVRLGQFFTVSPSWCTRHIEKFIKQSCCIAAYDPFVGNGDLLLFAKNKLGFTKTYGFDIDNTLGFPYNDSLIAIPHIDNAIIITNPPYVAKQSATRKKLNLEKYFALTEYDDLYLLAIDRMLEAEKFVVAIVPESFINSAYKHKDLLNSITILEENPFKDTENPVCVLCFDGISKPLSKVKIYKGDVYVNTLHGILEFKKKPKRNVDISFNDINGWLALRAVDSTDDKTFISFSKKEMLSYDWNSHIKNTSRHITLIKIDVPFDMQENFVQQANNNLHMIRQASDDVVLTPFKGNTKQGHRRRRLDYTLARAILEDTYKKVVLCEK